MIRIKNFRRQISKRFAAIILTFTIGISASFASNYFLPIQDIQLQDNQPSDVFEVETYQPPDYDEGTTCGLNPLSLHLRLNENRQIRLNMKNFGTLGENPELISELKDVFEIRTRNGAFRAGTDEIEKTVIVRANESTSYEDLTLLVSELEKAGANPIQLDLDGCLYSINEGCLRPDGF